MEDISLGLLIGVLATPATFQGALYASVVERFGAGVEFFQHTCPGLVSQIELGKLDEPKTRAILEDALLSMLEKNIDTVVLGCATGHSLNSRFASGWIGKRALYLHFSMIIPSITTLAKHVKMGLNIGV